MVKTCSIKGCRTTVLEKDIKMHKIPKNDIGEQWINVIIKHYPEFQPTKNTVLCSKHFLNTDYHLVGVYDTKMLKKTSVPSIFKKTVSKKLFAGPDELTEIIEVLPNNTNSLEFKSIGFTISNTYPSSSKLIETSEKINDSNISIPNRTLTPVHVIHNDMINSLNTPSNHCPEKTEDDSLNLKTCISKAHRKRKFYMGDFQHIDDINSPNSRLKYWVTSKRKHEYQAKKIKQLKNENYRLKNKIKSMDSLINHLKNEKKLISGNCFSVLKETLPSIENEIILNQLKMTTSKIISPEIRRFALTLNFYSPSAYNYVRTTFNKCLPHPSTLRNWYSSIDGSPGFTSESLNAVKIKCQEMRIKGKTLVCGIIMDEMYINDQIHYNGQNLQGFINYGAGKLDHDGLPRAKEALVFMLVALNSQWKIPIAYFLINSLNSLEKSNLVKTILSFLHETGIQVKTLTFDGTAANISMANDLGAQLSFPEIKTYFNHPETKEKVHIFLDPAHMIKLCRNTLGDWKTIYDKNKSKIEWDYFIKLVEIQEKTGLHVGTKIRRRHINFQKEKMKVKLAAQTFSTSVADSFDYCSTVLKLDEFKDVYGTSLFCRKINNTFDVLNTRNFLSKSKFNKPLWARDEIQIKMFIDESIDYIQNLQVLRNNSFQLLISSSRKTGFIGLLICLSSLRNFFDDVIKTNILDFFLTYKISQDHLEMFFSAIRAKGGFNNNPTASQFEAAYKRLIVHTEIKVSSEANCEAQDLTPILSVSSSIKKPKNNYLDLLCAEEDSDEQSIVDDIDFVNPTELQYIHDVVEYISGFIVRKIIKKISCITCVGAVINKNIENGLSLITIKNRGGLMLPSHDMVTLCKTAEQIFKTYQYQLSTIQNNPVNFLILKATSKLVIGKMFSCLSEHILNQSPLNNHLLQLLQLILKTYFTIRLHHYNKTEYQPKERIRSHLTKIVHFKNQ